MSGSAELGKSLHMCVRAYACLHMPECACMCRCACVHRHCAGGNVSSHLSYFIHLLIVFWAPRLCRHWWHNDEQDRQGPSPVWWEEMENIQGNIFSDCGSFLVWPYNKDVGAGCWELLSRIKPRKQGNWDGRRKPTRVYYWRGAL